MQHHNFSAGPGELPTSVLEEAQRALLEYAGTGLSILGLSHRSRHFAAIVEEAEATFQELLQLPRDYQVLFLQGGGSLQFSMVPMNLLHDKDDSADYITTGYWSKKALVEARLEGRIRVLYDGEPEGFCRVPEQHELAFDRHAAYLHYVSNETVEGIQFHETIGVNGVPRVCDMSSDMMSRPHNVQDFDLIYAHAQKNLGPAGVTVVVLHNRIIEKAPKNLPTMLSYRPHVEHRSIYNTPPVFAIYVTLLVARWLLREIGGLEKMARINQQKVDLLYGLLDTYPDVFVPHAERRSRSLMNVVFRLRNASEEARLIEKAEASGFHGIAGHRTRPGLRVSLYNAVTVESVRSLCAFLEEYAQAKKVAPR